jgi:penicillin-binding protein 1A
LKPLSQKLTAILLWKTRWFASVVKIIWISLLVFVVGITLYIFMVLYNPLNLAGDMPSLQAMEKPENDLSSEVISADGVSLGRYFRYNRSQVTYDDLSPELVRTLLISEDHRFYDHSGMDFPSYLRVLKGILTFSKQGGGSTLTQQTAKNLFRTRSEELRGRLGSLAVPLDLLISKTKEWIIAIKLEENFTKEEIIALYLNTVPFNNNAYGIKIAAQTYFNKGVKSLTVNESALLVGMLQGTNRFNPIEYPQRALDKRNQVLKKLYDHKYLKSKHEYDGLVKQPLGLKFSVENPNEGIAAYFRSVLRNDLMKWCKENDYDLFESGLKIYTTIDSRLQYLAEEALREHMRKLQKDFDKDWGDKNPWVDDNGRELADFIQRKTERTAAYKRLVARYGAGSDSLKIMLNIKRPMTVFSWEGERSVNFSTIDSIRYYNRFLHAGLMSMNPVNGEVKAWVGGIDHGYFQYDHVHQGKRQPGSTFKPFVYGKAMEDGYTPCFEAMDLTPYIKVGNTTYHPPNSGGGFGDGTKYTLRQALARSLNSVTMQLMEKLQPSNVAEFAKRMGIASKLDPVYALGLGTSDVALDEMVAAYCSFVNLGIYTEPYYISRIEDKYGNVIADFVPKPRQVINEKTAYAMVYMLRGVVEEEGGSAGGLSTAVTENNEVGGKTGTTNNASDGWFIGITPNLVTGVWVGGDERSIHFPRWGSGSGAKAALPVFDKFMTKVYRHPETGIKKGYFRQPSEMDISLDCD